MSDDEMAGGAVDMESNFPLDDMSNYDPQEVGTERDVSPDKAGGVMKKLLVRGEGFKSPEKGDEVTGAWHTRRRRRCDAAARDGAQPGVGSCFSMHLLPGPATRRADHAAARSALRRHAAGRHRV